jgi:hypothetical protein
MTQDQKDALARAMGIDPETQAALDAGSDHAYSCRCETCRRWWKAMGPADAGEDGGGADYGPFTKEEVERDD